MPTSFSHASFSGNNLECIRGSRLLFANLDFSVSSGESLTLQGSNGSGKSSLLRVMAGLLPPSRGELLWNIQPITCSFEKHSQRLFYIGHQDALKMVLSVRENLSLWMSVPSIEKALNYLKIQHLQHTPVRLLSAGQRRRVSLARLFAEFRPLWLLDEPTSHLDSDSIQILKTLIEEHLHQGGMAVLAHHGPLILETSKVINLGSTVYKEALLYEAN